MLLLHVLDGEMRQIIKLFNLFLLTYLIYLQTLCAKVEAQQQQQRQGRQQDTSNKLPSAIQSASYVSLDGLTLIVTFDRPINLSASIELVEQRLAAAAGSAANSGADYDEASQDGGAGQEQSQRRPQLATAPLQQPQQPQRNQKHTNFVTASSNRQQVGRLNSLQASASDNVTPKWADGSAVAGPIGGPPTCPASGRGRQQSEEGQVKTAYLVEGIQICAQVLSQKTLKKLRKFHLRNCVWPSQVQFLIQLGKPISASSAPSNGLVANAASQQLPTSLIRVAFKRSAIRPARGRGPSVATQNERELAVELAKLPLESLGMPLAPKLALAGPNQVPPCGQFSLSALLSSPFGTQSNESLRLSWSIERLGLVQLRSGGDGGGANATARESAPNANNLNNNKNREQIEQRWQELQEVVRLQTSNNLVLDSQMFEFVPQLYEVRLTATFVTSLTSFTLNSSHQISRLDYEAPLGTIYGSHLLAQENQVNTNRALVLLADIQVPDCAAASIKQVGAYWQVSEQRVRFEQTFAPFYLARPSSLPEQALIEFRLNLFYGVRVKKSATTSALILTGDSQLESKISDGLLVASVFSDEGGNGEHSAVPGGRRQLELRATGGGADGGGQTAPSAHESERHAGYLWSCFDGKTAQTCARAGGNGTAAAALLDKGRQRAQVLRLPIEWLESGAQLWFGLQRFDGHHLAAPAHQTAAAPQTKSEFALVTVQQPATGSGAAGVQISLGPILLGRSRQRASVRNPLTGSILLVAGAPVVIVGRLTSTANENADLDQDLFSRVQLTWHLENYVQPLNWLVRNETNSQTGKRELVSELHLGAELMVAHAHHQVMLTACLGGGGGATTTSASINVDVVQGVGECRVGLVKVGQRRPTAVAVNSCNIPLGLAPLSYQLYLVDTSATDSLVAASKPTQADEEHTNEADEVYFASLAQPLSAPQLSAVFPLGALSSGALSALSLSAAAGAEPQAGESAPTQARKVRLGAQVCDRLQVCRMFYSGPFDVESLSAATATAAAESSSAASLQGGRQAAPLWAANQALAVAARRRAMQLGQLVEKARKAHLAGKSIAAVSILNAVITSIGSQLNSTPTLQLERLQLEEDSNKLRDLLQYTESGQTNLVLSSLANILALPQVGKGAIESKFLALRLVDQLNRRSIEQISSQEFGADVGLTTLADLKTIQLVFESIFGSFSLHSTAGLDSAGRPRPPHGHRGGNESKDEAPASQQPNVVVVAPQQNKRKREEAVLAYLRAARHAHKSLLQAAAVQLGLGAVHQFEYQVAAAAGNADSGLDGGGGAADIVSSLTHQTTLLSDTIEVDLHEFGTVSVHFEAAAAGDAQQEPPAEQTQQQQQPAGLGVKLSRQLSGPQMSCKNATLRPSRKASQAEQTKCSSFVLALTSFAGKAPFRSLDSTGAAATVEGAAAASRNKLRVPVLQIDWLSPLDGSNLIELLRADETLQAQRRQLELADFSATVVFTIPADDEIGAAAANEEQDKKAFKCYHFDEHLNEWTQIETLPQRATTTIGNETASEPTAAAAGTQQIRCRFSGFGVVGAFQGEPPPTSQFSSLSAEVSLALKVGAVFALVGLISLIGCIAASSKSAASRSKRSRNSSLSSSWRGSTSTSSCEAAAAATEAVETTAPPFPRHLQQASSSYGNDFR